MPCAVKGFAPNAGGRRRKAPRPVQRSTAVFSYGEHDTIERRNSSGTIVPFSPSSFLLAASTSTL